jgi:sulfur carrier protein
MILIVAGTKKEYEEDLSVAKLIELEKVETPQYVTVSVNDEFVSGDLLAQTTLHDGDSVEFLYFMGGGQRSCRLQTIN